MHDFPYLKYSVISPEVYNVVKKELSQYLIKSGYKILSSKITAFNSFISFLENKKMPFSEVTIKELEIFSPISKKKKHEFTPVKAFLIKEKYACIDINFKYNKNCTTGFETHIESFLNYKKIGGISVNSINTYRKYLNDASKYFSQNENICTLSEINRDMLERFMFHLLNVKRPQTSQRLSLNNAISRLITVRQYFKYLSHHDLIVYNPALKLQLPKEEKTVSKNYLEQSELSTFMSALPLDNEVQIRNRLLCELAYHLGLRIKEVLQIKISDIQSENGTVKIQGKGGHIRHVPMTSFINSFLHIFIDTVWKKHFINEDGFLFYTTKYMKNISELRFCRNINVIFKEMGFAKDVSFHVFRKSIGKHLLDNGLGVRYVQSFLGHRDINSTVKYTQLNLDDLKKILSSFHPRETAARELTPLIHFSAKHHA